MRITEAAGRLDLTPRMLRYREALGLLPAVRPRRGRRGSSPQDPATSPDGRRQPGAVHRRYSEADLSAVALGLSIERRYGISPVALSFALQVLADQRARAEVAELGRRIGRIQPPPARALDFEQERARRLLRLDRRRPDPAG